jgi:hypothetical protein
MEEDPVVEEARESLTHPFFPTDTTISIKTTGRWSDEDFQKSVIEEGFRRPLRRRRGLEQAVKIGGTETR